MLANAGLTNVTRASEVVVTIEWVRSACSIGEADALFGTGIPIITRLTTCDVVRTATCTIAKVCCTWIFIITRY
jgi:hypothetical protein